MGQSPDEADAPGIHGRQRLLAVRSKLCAKGGSMPCRRLCLRSIREAALPMPWNTWPTACMGEGPYDGRIRSPGKREIRRLTVLLAGLVLLVGVLILNGRRRCRIDSLTRSLAGFAGAGDDGRLPHHLQPAHASRHLRCLGRGQSGLVGLHTSKGCCAIPWPIRALSAFLAGAGSGGYGLDDAGADADRLGALAAFAGALGRRPSSFPGLGAGRQSPASGPGRGGRGGLFWRRHDGFVRFLFR